MAKKILIVDDEAELVELLSSRLHHAGYEVDEAQNGREGLGAIVDLFVKEEPFDLILLDVRMPGMTGIEVLDALRKEELLRGIPEGAGIPVILITAFKHEKMKSFNRSTDDYLLKPLQEDTLLKKISEKLNDQH